MQTALANELPHSAESERAIVGLTLMHQQIPTGARALATTDFYLQPLRDIWAACLELEEEHQPIETVSVFENLKKNSPSTASIYPVSGLGRLVTETPDGNEVVYVQKILSAANRRYLIRRLDAGINALTSGDKDAIIDLRRDLAELEITDQQKTSFIPFAEIVENEIRPALMQLTEGVTPKISTGFKAIDAVIGGGISLSDMLLVAGLPGGGKSAFVLQLASNIAKQGIPVAYLSGEMSNKENGLRILSQFSGTTNLNSVTRISAEDLEFYDRWLDSIAKLPIYFDSRTCDLRTLAPNLRAVVDRYKVKALVVDYVQLLKLNQFDKHGRTERVAEVSQELKRIAMEFGIAVIEVAQFNREGVKSGKPQMHDLEGSSQLEKDTSLIFIIDQNKESQEVGLRIVKGRNTGRAEIKGSFAGHKLTFEFE
jgi:replicative DNA helicase